jgi:hypothetical protein
MILCTFKKLWKLCHVCPFVPPLGTTWLLLDEFSWNFIFRIFWKSVEKSHVSLKSDKNTRYLTWRIILYILIVSRSVLLRMRNVSGKSYKGNQNTIFHSIIIFLKLCCLWHNMEKLCRARYAIQMTIRCMCIACWITQATNTHSQYVILIALPWQQWFCECTSNVTVTCTLSVLFVSVNKFWGQIALQRKSLYNTFLHTPTKLLQKCHLYGCQIIAELESQHILICWYKYLSFYILVHKQSRGCSIWLPRCFNTMLSYWHLTINKAILCKHVKP